MSDHHTSHPRRWDGRTVVVTSSLHCSVTCVHTEFVNVRAPSIQHTIRRYISSASHKSQVVTERSNWMQSITRSIVDPRLIHATLHNTTATSIHTNYL